MMSKSKEMMMSKYIFQGFFHSFLKNQHFNLKLIFKKSSKRMKESHLCPCKRPVKGYTVFFIYTHVYSLLFLTFVSQFWWFLRFLLVCVFLCGGSTILEFQMFICWSFNLGKSSTKHLWLKKASYLSFTFIFKHERANVFFSKTKARILLDGVCKKRYIVRFLEVSGRIWRIQEDSSRFQRFLEESGCF